MPDSADDDGLIVVELDLDDPDAAAYMREREAPQHDPVIIVRETLAQALPCPACTSTTPCRCLPPEGYSATNARAVLVVEALRHFRHLPPADEPEPPGFDPLDAARVLADRSGFPRYEGAGYVKVLQSDADVDLAMTYALRRCAGSEVEMIRAARAGLLDWRKATPPDVIEQVVAAGLREV